MSILKFEIEKLREILRKATENFQRKKYKKLMLKFTLKKIGT